MPGFAPPAELWVAGKLSQLSTDVAALKAQGTEYIVDNEKVCRAIIGHLVAEPDGTATGLSGWGIAVYTGSEWVKLPGVTTGEATVEWPGSTHYSLEASVTVPGTLLNAQVAGIQTGAVAVFATLKTITANSFTCYLTAPLGEPAKGATDKIMWQASYR
jgi:hypothetical protein